MSDTLHEADAEFIRRLKKRYPRRGRASARIIREILTDDGGRVCIEQPQSLPMEGGMRDFVLLVIAILVLVGGLLFAGQSRAAEVSPTQAKFHEVFITAGYSTALGAGLGLACSTFTPKSDTFQSVLMGASVGFISGSIFGGYLVLRPVLVPSAGAVTPKKWAVDAELTLLRF